MTSTSFQAVETWYRRGSSGSRLRKRVALSKGRYCSRCARAADSEGRPVLRASENVSHGDRVRPYHRPRGHLRRGRAREDLLRVRRGFYGGPASISGRNMPVTRARLDRRRPRSAENRSHQTRAGAVFPSRRFSRDLAAPLEVSQTVPSAHRRQAGENRSRLRRCWATSDPAAEAWISFGGAL